MSDSIRIIVVGMGERAQIYARESLLHPELFQVVGVVDIDSDRIRHAKELFQIPDQYCFSSVEALTAVPKFADAVINGTMDKQHVSTTIPLLRHGYHVLLEKPFAVNEREAERLLNCVRETGSKVMVCHVLRYAPFYRYIYETVCSGEIGQIINIQMTEQVSYFHESVSYVRGKYASPEICGSGMLLSKCSHDLDIMAWLMGANLPVSVSSVGSVFQFKPEMAPDGAGTHCMNNCPIERMCPYSARRLYMEFPQRWANNIWHDCGFENIQEGQKESILSEPDNPYSRCIYRCNQQIVDHQSVMVHFANGATGTFNMNGGASASGRHIHITGTLGEIVGNFENEYFNISLIAPEMPDGRWNKEINVSEMQHGNAHGCGDQAVIRDFVTLLRGETTSSCCTMLEDSMIGHCLVFLAEKSRKNNGEMQKYER